MNPKTESPGQSPDSIRKINEARAAVEEMTLQRIGFSFIEQNIAFLERNPRDVIKELVEALPEMPKVVTQSGLRDFLSETRLDNGRESILDHGEVSPLESYLVFLLLLRSPESTYLESVQPSSDDSFSIADSVRILRDQVRTKRFLQGIAHSIGNLRLVRGSEENILVCDAGCGSIPILGLYAALQDESVNVLCIENNPEAAGIAQKYVDICGLTERVSVIVADARTVDLPEMVDLLVSETMDVGLFNEPMTEILNHLAPYVKEGGIMIPSQVNILASVVPVSAYKNASEYTIVDADAAPILSTQWHVVGSYKAGEPRPEVVIDLPVSESLEGSLVMITSEVIITQNSPSLLINQSRLTQPITVPVTPQGHMRVLAPGTENVRFSYMAGSHPSAINIE